MTLTTMSSVVPPVSSPYDTSTGYSSATHGLVRVLLTDSLTSGSSLTSLTASTRLGVLDGEAAASALGAPFATASLLAGPSSRAPVPPVAQAVRKRPRAVSAAVAALPAFRTCLARVPRPRNAPAPHV